MTTRTTARWIVTLGAAGILAMTGCESGQGSPKSMGELPKSRTLTLGAGDDLGVQIFTNDRIIAAREARQSRPVASVPAGE